MNLRHIGIVYGKELREALRDRRTLLVTLLLPIVVMPLLSLGLGGVAVRVAQQAGREAAPIALIGEESPTVRAALEARPRLRLAPATEDFRRRIEQKEIRAAVELPAGFEAALARGEPTEVKIHRYEGELRSSLAAEEVEKALLELRAKTVKERLREHGLPETLVRPFRLVSENAVSPSKVGGNALGGFLPYVFILLSLAGAASQAIDLTAGEKERGTIETLLSSMASRLDLALGKFLMVVTASLASVSASLLSMAGTALLAGLWLGPSFDLTGLARAGSDRGQPLLTLDPVGILGAVALIVPLAVVFSALLMALALFAKSLKEAQMYASIVATLSFAPSLAGLVPGVELTPMLALVPILNVALAGREMVGGSFPWGSLLLIFGSTCLYAAAALALCVRMFNRESVLFRA